MREIRVPELTLRAGHLDAAFGQVFGPGTVRAFHGPTTVVGDFVDDKREFTFELGVDRVPAPIRYLFCGSRLRVTTRQTLECGTDTKTVTNDIKMHFVGAELFGVKSAFSVRRDDDSSVRLAGMVRHSARLPPPLRGIAERFMAAHSERELRRFAEVLRARSVLEES